MCKSKKAKRKSNKGKSPFVPETDPETGEIKNMVTLKPGEGEDEEEFCNGNNCSVKLKCRFFREHFIPGTIHN